MEGREEDWQIYRILEQQQPHANLPPSKQLSCRGHPRSPGVAVCEKFPCRLSPGLNSSKVLFQENSGKGELLGGCRD